MAEFYTAGGGASNALDEILTRQKLEARQKLLDSIAQDNQRMAAQRENRADELQRQSAKDLEFNREDNRASRLYENMLPGEVDPMTAELLKKHGYGGDFQQKVIPGQVQYQGETPDTRDPSRTAIWSEGGAKYASAREAARERAAQAEEAQKERDAAAIADDKRNADLRTTLQENALKQAKLLAQADDKRADQVIQDKKTEAETTRNKKLESARAGATQTLGIVNQLINPDGKLAPELNSVVGTNWFDHVPEWYKNNVGLGVGGGIDKSQKLEQLKARLTTDLIMELKTLSSSGATGMGNMSNKDVEILQNAAGMLSRAQSEEQLQAQLVEIRDRLKLFLTPQDAGNAGGGGGGGVPPPSGPPKAPGREYIYDINGNPVSKK